MFERALPRPRVEAGQVRIRLRAASLNHRDLMVLRGAFAAATVENLVPLSDGAGEVVEIGHGVWRAKVGDRVALTFNPDWIAGEWESTPGRLGRGGGVQGVACEEIVVHQNETVSIPGHLSFEEAATLPCAAVTAWSAMVQGDRLLPGQSVLVQGSGGVSIFALQFARLFGLRVIATTSSAEKVEHLRALGADAVIDTAHHPDWQKEVLHQTEGRGVDRVVELGGDGNLARSIAATRQGGHIALVGLLAGVPEAAPGLFFRGLSVGVARVGSRADFVRMMQAIAYHRLRPVIDRNFAFEHLKEALRHLESGRHVGKIVLQIGQDPATR